MISVFFTYFALMSMAAGVLTVALKNPVHCALGLVLTLFGVAVQFVAQEAHFLAAVQVIVYAGAIVILFLFVIMLLGVDQADDLEIEPIVGAAAMNFVLAPTCTATLGYATGLALAGSGASRSATQSFSL